jgi:hypothetical protein
MRLLTPSPSVTSHVHHAVLFPWPSLTTDVLWAGIIAAVAAVVIVPITLNGKKKRETADEEVRRDTLETNAWIRRTQMLNISVQKFIKFTDLFGKDKDE